MQRNLPIGCRRPAADQLETGQPGSWGVAFIRGLARQLSDTLGNFWVDLTRALLWILLPGALIGALLLVWQGVPMNFHRYAVVTTVEGAQQVIP
jgi:K+-transporting ATPase ATPase A chain